MNKEIQQQLVNIAVEAFNGGLKQGTEIERQRIITMLEEMRKTCFEAKTDVGQHGGWTLENAIVLIKGENE